MELQIIHQKIHEIRGQKVMLDFDLAELYEVETRTMNQAVRRNIERFPEDFMFLITPEEWEVLKLQSAIPRLASPNSSQIVTSSANLSQIVIGSQKHREYKKLPLAFTEQGIAMLSGVLRSDKAIGVNISIMRAFVMLRRYVLAYSDLAEKIADLEIKYEDVYEVLNLLLEAKNNQAEWENRPRIGFKK